MLKQGTSMGPYIRGGPIQMGAYIRDFTVVLCNIFLLGEEAMSILQPQFL